MTEFHISNTLLLRQATLVTFWLSLEIVMNIHIQLITEMPTILHKNYETTYMRV